MSTDLQEVKQDVKELLQRSAVHNELLRTHEARSLALQASQKELDQRLNPIEKHVNLVDKALKGLGLIVTGVIVGATVQALIKLLF